MYYHFFQKFRSEKSQKISKKNVRKSTCTRTYILGDGFSFQILNQKFQKMLRLHKY